MTGRRIAVAVALLLVFAAAVAGCRGGGGPAVGSPEAQPPSQPAAVEEKPDVPVLIEAYYPLNEGHMFIVDYLKSIEAANPDTVKVFAYDMQSEEGRAKWAATGLSCAGVFVNGSTRHEIDKDGTTETVDFLQRLDVFWSRSDFEAVVAQELEKAGKTFAPPAKEASAEGGEKEPEAGAAAK